MDNKITKERVNIHFEYDWTKYIAALLVAVFIFALLYTTLAPRLKTYEEIKFLSLTYPVTGTLAASQDEKGLMAQGMLDFFKAKAEAEAEGTAGEEAAGPVIKNVDMESMSPDAQGFGEWLVTRLISNFDFAIGPESYFLGEGQFAAAVIDNAAWKDESGAPYIDVDKDLDTDGERAKALAGLLGFKDAEQLCASLLFDTGENEGKFKGFILNGFDNIKKLFTAIGPLPEDGETAEEDMPERYVLGILSGGGNLGPLNKSSKKKDMSGYNEALDALKYFIGNYSGK